MRRVRSHRASRSVPLTPSCEILPCEPQEVLGEATIPRGWRAAVPGPDSCDETTCRVPTLQASALKKVGIGPPHAAHATRGGFWFVSQLLARVFAASDYARPKRYAHYASGTYFGRTTRRVAASAAVRRRRAYGKRRGRFSAFIFDAATRAERCRKQPRPVGVRPLPSTGTMPWPCGCDAAFERSSRWSVNGLFCHRRATASGPCSLQLMIPPS